MARRKGLELSRLPSKYHRRGNSLRIAVLGRGADISVVKELLSPWSVLFTGPKEADVAIVYKKNPSEAKRTIIIPPTYEAFAHSQIRENRAVTKPRRPVSVAVGPQTTLTIRPEAFYHSDIVPETETNSSVPSMVEHEDGFVCLTLDVISEYRRIIGETLSSRPAHVYRLLAGLPVSYRRAPKQLRSLFMRKYGGHGNLSICDKLPLDALRFVLVQAIERIVGRKLEKKLWNGKMTAVVLTHDVESRRGLIRAKTLKKIENRYDVPTTWYIPSKSYELNVEAVRDLASHGEVGAHDTKHDGKLADLSQQRMIERLLDAKKALEKVLGRSVSGFRAPLLQHNLKIIRALRETGYTYDASVPTWEPNHPYVMKPHGIGTVNIMGLEKMVEVPVTLPQDDQMLHVLGMTAEQTFETWGRMRDTIRDIGGVCAFLIHPDYELADSANLRAYEGLLNDVSTDSDAWITTPSEIGK